MANDWDDTVAALPNTVELDAEAGRAYLVIVRGGNLGKVHLIIEPGMVIGRAASADLQLNDEGVSRFHCRLRHEAGGIVIEDLDSRNGTFLNGERVASGVRALVEGDRLQIGTTSVLRFTYESTDSAPAPKPGEHSAIRDTLTGTYSRRSFIDRLESEIGLALTHERPLSLVLIHVDRFAELSTRGQEVTDQVTISIAAHIGDSLREDDLVARIADGEFALMLRWSSPGDTYMLAERLRTSSAELIVPTPNGPDRVTLSLAIAAVHELRVETTHDLLLAAGSGLHRARSQGGNRVVLCTRDFLRETGRIKV